nr:polysaccharide deacetylase family protein [Haloglomus sp. DT116]
MAAALDGHEFAVCLTHDVDRVHKTFQTVYYAVRDRDPGHLRALLPGVEPYWQFETVMELERDLGVRSAFYFLDEQPLRERPVHEWVDPERWKLHTARYDVEAPRIADTITALDRGGWEVGLHGSYDSYRDRSLLAEQKATIERVLGHPVTGGRQHYLNLEVPETWRRQADVGLSYDASLGSSTRYGFQHGYGPFRPFEDRFVVFPLTLMEVALPDPAPGARDAGTGSGRGRSAAGASGARRRNEGVTATDGGASPAVSAAAREVCDDLLDEARRNGAVMTVLWHPRYFAAEFPGYRECYRYVVERALEMDAWVGPPGELYARLPHG